MKKTRYLAIFLAIICLLMIAAPTMVSASSLSVKVTGMELFPGFNVLGNKIGATFVATPTDPYKNGSMFCSINYHGTAPVPGGSNTLIGGYWSLTVINSGKCDATSGKILGGQVLWFPTSPPGTDVGEVTAQLSISSGSGVFKGATSGLFVGEDIHKSGLFIGGIQVPVITGTVTFSY